LESTASDLDAAARDAHVTLQDHEELRSRLAFDDDPFAGRRVAERTHSSHAQQLVAGHALKIGTLAKLSSR